MNPLRKKRLVLTSLFVLFIGLAVTSALVALKQNINLFYTPSQVKKGQIPVLKSFRVGGMVEKGSIKRSQDGLTVQFLITDTANTLKISYRGILPDLFREGQGVVVEGKMDKKGVFQASQVLAKHDENYMPPMVKHSLQQVIEMKQQHAS